MTVVRYNINPVTVTLAAAFLVAYALGRDEWAIFLILGLILVIIVQNLIFAYKEMLSY